MENNSLPKENNSPPNPNVPEKRRTPFSAYIWLGFAVLYVLSPIDLLPDVPFFGWIDDVFVVLAAVLNLFQQHETKINASLAHILRYLKWGVLILGAIFVCLTVLLGSFLVSLFS